MWPTVSLWIWVSIGALASLMVALFGASGIDSSFLLVTGPLALGITIVPLAVRSGYMAVLDWEPFVRDFARESDQAVRAWFDEQTTIFESSAIPRSIGVLYIVVASVAFPRGGAFSDCDTGARIAGWLILGVSAYASGVGVGSVGYLALFLCRAGRRFQVRVDAHRFGVRSQGRLLIHIYLLACLGLCVFTLSAAGAKSDPATPLYGLALPTVVVLLGTFFGSQLPMHRRMVEDKRFRLRELRKLTDAIAPQDADDLTPERMAKIEHLVKQTALVADLPEWPVGKAGGVTAVLGSIWAVSPTILAYVAEHAVGG